MKPKIYNKNVELIGVIQNATEVGYVHKFNDLYTASFKLPVDDPKNSLCEAYNIVDIFDGDESKGKYRILESPDSDITSTGSFVEYTCEHVIAFLLNDIIDGYLELGGTGVTTATVIRTLLSKQTVTRWRLGRCDFNYQFQYSWENTNVLEALFSVATCFADKYRWTYDTTTYPWTINLIAQGTTRDCEIRYRRNMTQVKRKIDYSALCTRLYCKGNGEGVNQLTIKEVNNNVPYLDADAATIAKYGILCSHFIDLTCTDATTLKAKGQQILNEVKNPIYTYTANAVDLNKITGLAWDRFDEGKNVHIVNDDKGVNVDAMIIEVSKKDVDAKPLDMDIVISSKPTDVASDIEDLSRRAAITAQYSQGATNLYCEQFADNADADHPAKMRIYIPESCSKINQVLLNWQCEAFRAYSKSAAGGGSSTTTSSSGGGATATSSAGGGATVTSAAGGQTTATVEQSVCGDDFSTTSQTGQYSGYAWGAESDGSAGKYHRHEILHYHGGRVYITVPSQTISISSHKHNVTISDHTHSVTIPDHTHTLTLGDHTHDLVYGIYEGETASKCTLKVDGNVARQNVTSGTDIDIIPYLSKDQNGKINRGVWHTIEIVPDKMSRIEADLFVKTFITSYSGGNY